MEACGMSDERRGCVILGSGNVAGGLAPALNAAGIDVRQVYSRSLDHASELALQVGAEAVDKLEDIVRDARLYVIALSDDAVAPVAAAMTGTGGLWVHTAGGVDASVLAPASRSYGVLYPLQTFSKGRGVDMKKVPLFIEGADPATLSEIREIAQKLSDNVSEADSRKRLVLHAAAVFACNFVNYLWGTADEILQADGEDIHVLEPLIRETLAKAMAMPPRQAQTGPARRGDTKVAERHKTVITPEQARLYSVLADAIAKEYADSQTL